MPWIGTRAVQKIIDRAGLPLKADGAVDETQARLATEGPALKVAEQYDADGWFTGVRATVTIPKPPQRVYNSLKTDFHKVFTPISECIDEARGEEGACQKIFRIIRIPFRVAFVTGNLKLRLNITQSTETGVIHLENAQEGRLISNLVADFTLSPPPAIAGNAKETTLTLDCKMACKQPPPGMFHNLVKGVMVQKVDACMADLLRFHERRRKSITGKRGSLDLEAASFRSAKSRRLSLDSIADSAGSFEGLRPNGIPVAVPA